MIRNACIVTLFVSVDAEGKVIESAAVPYMMENQVERESTWYLDSFMVHPKFDLVQTVTRLRGPDSIDTLKQIMLSMGFKFVKLPGHPIVIVYSVGEGFRAVPLRSEFKAKAGTILRINDVYTVPENFSKLQVETGEDEEHIKRCLKAVGAELIPRCPMDGDEEESTVDNEPQTSE